MFWKRTLIRTQRTKRTDTFNGHLHLSILHILSKKENKRTTQRTTTKKMKRTITLRKYSKQLSNLHLLNQKETHMSLQSWYAKERMLGRKGTDAPATGLGTYKLMSDWAQVSRFMNHFNLLDKISRVWKPTESIPTLQVRLKETFTKLKTNDSINTEPLRIQKASRGKTELWAHLPP